MNIPACRPVTTTERNPDWFTPSPYGSVFPPIQKAPDGRLAVDWYQDGDDVVVKMWKRADHPGMQELPEGCPKEVRTLFTADFQLKLLRATEVPSEFLAAAKAWDKWKDRTQPVSS